VEDIGDCESGIAIDVIALSKGVVQDVHLKDGTIARKGELTVEDDTGEVKLVAWRGVADRFVEIEPGDRVRFLGLKRQVTKMGVYLLEFTSASVIERTSRAAG
jgi:ssDNA-binding replication factor A large subunit